MKTLRILVFCLCFGTAAPIGQDYDQPPIRGIAPVTLEQSDHQFVAGAWRGSMEGVQLSKLAMTKARFLPVRRFSKALSTGFGAMSDQLQTIAARRGFVFNTFTAAQYRQAFSRLSNLRGRAFDVEFLGMVASHLDAMLAEFDAFTQTTEDPQLYQWAVMRMNTLRAFLQSTERMLR